MAMLRIPTPLRRLFQGREEASAAGATGPASDRRGDLARGKYYLTFPPDLEQQSVICDMYDRLGVKFSIRQAHVGDDVAILGVELLGLADQLRVAESYLASRGVRVETIAVVPVE